MVLLQNVSKLYKLYQYPSDRLREALPFGTPQFHRDFWALRDIGFQVEKGETLGLVGPNGCGKSTLLQIICGILQPTTGRVVTRGRIAALLELGAGFNPEFTGRENVFLNGEIMGLSRAEIERAMPSIEAFAEIGEFIDRPVKEYSSGMYVRLAFATAIHVDPEILIVDEALAVGDAVFANRCVRKFEELRERKITVLFVSHDLGLVKQLSDRAIFLLNGRIEAAGRAERRDQSLHRAGARNAAGPGSTSATEAALRRQLPARRWHQRDPRASRLLERGGRSRSRRSRAANRSPCACAAAFSSAKSDPMVGILIRTRIGMDVYGTNTHIEQAHLGRLPGRRRTGGRFQLRVLADAAAIHADRGHPESRRHESRLAGRRDRLRRRGYAVGGGRCESQGKSGMARITVRVHPRAKRTRVAGNIGRRIQARSGGSAGGRQSESGVHSVPRRNWPACPRSRVRIVLGLTNRTKVIEIEGVSQELLEGKLRA